ncbi:MAG: hypothetical protein AAFP79_04920 [Pseudomonadota bacterium]
MTGWFRPARRAFWRATGWHRVHKMMSAQALTAGMGVVTVLIHFNYPKGAVFIALALTLIATMYGSLVPQPELHDEQSDPE